ncbi:MAG: class I SAM-dependent methyltransferase [Myxococcota bacterium]|nr:class I SAM-dependent methyltransferase [Myxococcota bacterium]
MHEGRTIFCVMQPEAELRARLYSLVHRGMPGDIAFYRHEAQNKRSVIELGAGTGRILREVAGEVRNAVGIEHSAGMIAQATDLPENAVILHADACAFSVDQQFDLVIIPYNALFAFGGIDRMRQALQCARKHARTGATLLFDCYVLNDDDYALLLPVDQEQIATVIDQGRSIAVFEWEEPLTTPRSFTMAYRYEITMPNGSVDVMEDRVHHHWLPPMAMERLLRAAGWRLIGLEAAFTRVPLAPDDIHLVGRAVAME